MVKKQKLWLSVWGYYVLTLLPVLGIVQVGSQAMADRYTYLPSLGPFLLISLIASGLWQKSPLRRAWAGLVIVVAILVISSLSFLTYQQIAIWKDSLTLWSYVADRERQDTPLVHSNLGLVYNRLNMPEKTIEQYLTAIRLQPDFLEAHDNLGNIYQTLNMPDKAVEQYLIAIKQSPGYPEPHFNLGVLYYRMGQMENARTEFIAGLKIKPDDQRAQQLLKAVNREQ